MGIDVHLGRPHAQDSYLYTIDDGALLQLDSVFVQLQQQTGVSIDPYGTTRIVGGRSHPLATLLQQHASNAAAGQLLDAINRAQQADTVLTLVGD